MAKHTLVKICRFLSILMIMLKLANGNYEIRLVNGDTNELHSNGRLEVFYNGEWGTVCDDMFTDLTAATLCGFLGYSRGYFAWNSAFGRGTGPIWLDNVVCSGTETNIDQCDHIPWGSNNCDHDEDVGLMCSNLPILSELYELKLINGEETATSLSGQLEVFFGGVWGPVCGDNVNEVTAVSLCRFLGYSRGYRAANAVFGEPTNLFWLDNLMCSGNETTISECTFNKPWRNNDRCKERNGLGLVCTNLSEVSETYAVRLVDGHKTTTRLSGRLEVFYGGVWGTVSHCYNNANELTAVTFCGFFGYRDGTYWNTFFSGAGTGVVWLNNVICAGNETDISKCSHGPWGSSNCSHSRDLWLSCSGPTRCSINGTPYNDGEVDPNASCRVCDSARDPSEFTLMSQKCFVNDVCYDEGDEDPNDPCKKCISAISTTSFSPISGCSINGVCYADKAMNPDNTCEQCDVSVSASHWSSALHELKNGRTITCSRFCDFIRLQGASLISDVCSNPVSVSTKNFRDICFMKDTSSLHCPAGGITLTKYKAMCSHTTASGASADAVVCP
ncbi:neurotrypsin-like [Liolophura sinensis]|uniref:neurotrypsin-like n=1 Tax=Liolophura sinensis TaxID=3198878 RepID=UPI003158056C